MKGDVLQVNIMTIIRILGVILFLILVTFLAIKYIPGMWDWLAGTLGGWFKKRTVAEDGGQLIMYICYLFITISFMRMRQIFRII